MKTTIFHFSGTGNTLKIARDVAAGLGDTELVPMAAAMKGDIDLSADRIGIACPVYCWGPPVIVREFVKKLAAAKGKYIFTLLTFGGSPSKTNVQINALLKEEGLSLSAGFAVHMPGNAISVYGAWTREKQQKLFDAVPGRVNDIVAYITSGKTGRIDTGGMFMNVVGTIVYKPLISKMKDADKGFVVGGSCTGCGICAKACPVGNITMADQKPVWHNNCEQCMRCIQWCPEEAIQIGKATEKRKRYRHPAVKAGDFYDV